MILNDLFYFNKICNFVSFESILLIKAQILIIIK